jgi:thiol:disulfide interchange protein DsbD
VKVILGFIELALAVKFLSNADLVQQWHFLERETFISLWLAISACITVYLVYRMVKSHNKTIQAWIIRPLFILFFGAFTIYLIPGVTNTTSANLKLISGFPPPACYSIYSNPVNCKRGFKPLENDYEAALAKARKENKPLLLDFTGWACVNCRKMEENVWTSPLVDSLMRNKFVVVSFYVDEREKLPVAERSTVTLSNGSTQSIITVGQKWTVFQTENFLATSQPQYAIISPDEKALTKTKYYTHSAQEFAGWLECGLDAFKRKK